MKIRMMAVILPLIAGCFAGHQTEEGTRECVASDGTCCTGEFSIRVLADEACPAGTTEPSECPTADCDDACSLPPIRCAVDFGTGCCGAVLEHSGCTRCPLGSVDLDVCLEFSDRAPDRNAPECHVELSPQLCGCVVESNACGSCPAGSIRNCMGFASCLMM